MASAMMCQAQLSRATLFNRAKVPVRQNGGSGRRIVCSALPMHYVQQVFPEFQQQEFVQPASASSANPLHFVDYFPAPPMMPPASSQKEDGGDYKGYAERFVPKDDEAVGRVPGTPADSDSMAVDAAGRPLEKSPAIAPTAGSVATAGLLKTVDYFPTPPSMPPSSSQSESGGDYKGYSERFVPKDDEGAGILPGTPADSDANDAAGRVQEKSPVQYRYPPAVPSDLLKFVDYFPAPPSMPPSSSQGESGGDYKGYSERFVPKDDEAVGRVPGTPADSDANDVSGRVLEKSAI